jgi:hypothetical protein
MEELHKLSEEQLERYKQDTPIEVREKARHIWSSIKELVQVNPEDEPQVLFRIEACLMLHPLAEKLFQQIGESPAFQALMEKAKAQIEAQVAAIGVLPRLTTGKSRKADEPSEKNS